MPAASTSIEGGVLEETRPTGIRVLVHWFFVAEVLLLVLTGFWLRFPGVGGPYGLSRFMHLVTAYALFPTLAFRIYWAFFGRLRFDAPLRALGRLGAGRRILSHYWIYLLVWFVLALMTLTGLALRFPAEPAFGWLVSLLGSALYVRLWHYLLTWPLISVVLLHAYQTYLWDRGRMLEMFVPPPGRKDPGLEVGQSGETA